uniref:HECT-type E3 ubiquitin transferase n=1 Tax=Aplanochytrium stocchinoi TaxID=215587 RepID=A0A7S3LU98_9STRA
MDGRRFIMHRSQSSMTLDPNSSALSTSTGQNIGSENTDELSLGLQSRRSVRRTRRRQRGESSASTNNSADNANVNSNPVLSLELQPRRSVRRMRRTPRGESRGSVSSASHNDNVSSNPVSWPSISSPSSPLNARNGNADETNTNPSVNININIQEQNQTSVNVSATINATAESNGSSSSSSTAAANTNPNLQMVDLKRAQEIINHLRNIPYDSGDRTEATMIQALRSLRNCIQSSTASAALFAKAGAINVLLERLQVVKTGNQVMVLQILAALGYLVQHNEARSAVFTSEGGIDVLVSLLQSKGTGEGILLLGVQVLTFVVHNSPHRLRNLDEKGGIDTMCAVIQRGCVKSVLLNERATSLLGQLISLHPKRGEELVCELIHGVGKHMKQGVWDHGEPNLWAKVNDQLTTLMQSLKMLLEGHPERAQAVLNCGGVDILFKILLTPKTTMNLLETTVWVVSLIVDGSTERALAVEKLDASTRLLDIVKNSKTNDALMISCSHAFHHILVALSRDPATEVVAENICKSLGEILLYSSKSAKQAYHPLYATPNAMRVTRQLIQLSGGFEMLTKAGVLDGIVILTKCIVKAQKLTSNHSGELKTNNEDLTTGNLNIVLGGGAGASINENSYLPHIMSKSNVQQDVLQELGLLVEGDVKSATYLAETGALNELCTIVRTGRNPLVLCSATRALACFVEHNGQDGAVITDAATAAGCDQALLELITASGEDPNVDDEVLLNTVGALGYMVKRQAKIEKEKQNRERDLIAQSLNEKTDTNLNLDSKLSPSSNTLDTKQVEYRKRRTNACSALVNILTREHASESLLWNVTWALIYLMDDGLAVDCIEAVHGARGFEALIALMQRADASPSILNSAARALCALIKVYPEKTKLLDLDTRIALLSISVRGEENSTDTENENTGNSEINENNLEDSVNAENGQVVEIAIDPSNIVQSSMCTLEKMSAKNLRKKGLRIHYTSKELDQVGIDAGGLRRDWLSRLSAEIFDPKFNLVIWGFNPPDSVQISPKPSFGGLNKDQQDKWYRLMGRVLGLSVLYQDPLGVALVPPLCKRLFDEQPMFEDIKHVSEQYYKTFTNLNKYREKDRKVFEESLKYLTFTVNSRESIMKEAFGRSGMKKDDEYDTDEEIDNKAGSGLENGSHSASSILQKIESTKIRTLEQVSDALSEARHTQDRSLIRELLTRQNELREQKEQEGFADSDRVLGKRKKTMFELIRAASEKKIKFDEKFENKLHRMISDVADGGELKSINGDNYDLYLSQLTYKLLVENSNSQVAAVKKGLYEIIPKRLLLKLLTPEEFGLLVEGDRNISIESWKQHTKYKGGSVDTEQVKWFWEYVEGLDQKSRQKVLQWSTGWRSIGQSGFGHRKFTIELTSVSCKAENQRLPSVATCGFHMWLPKYTEKQQLFKKFERAVCETAFGNC